MAIVTVDYNLFQILKLRKVGQDYHYASPSGNVIEIMIMADDREVFNLS